MNKEYRLIIFGSNRFALANDTDADLMSDYSPGLWGLKSQKNAIKYALAEIASGNNVKVETYQEARHAALANKFIKVLGISQAPYPVEPAIAKFETGDAPANLAQLKKHLAVGKTVRCGGYVDGKWSPRDTFVKRVQTNSVVLDKNGSDSWLEFGKANEWGFDREGATHFYLGKEGRRPSMRIEYIKN